MVRLRATTELKKVPRLSRDGWHLLVRYMWRQLRLDGTTQLLSNPENKPVKRALHAALLSSETAWPAFGRADFFFFFFPPFYFWSQHEWVSEWSFDLAAFICQSGSVAFKAQSWKAGRGLEGGDVGQNRGQYSKKKRPRNKRRGLGSGATGSQWSAWKTGN